MKKLALIFLCIIFFGCYNIVLEEENNGYETIDGLWHVNIQMLENTCNPDDDFESFDTQLFVTVQDWPEDGGYIADFFVGDVYWLDVEVGADGNFFYENDYGILIDVFEGNIVPGRINATFGFEVEDICYRMLTIHGYQPYDHNPPPEGFEE